MKSKSLLALSILCLVLGACATDTAAKDPNIASPEDHANQTSAAARDNAVSYSTLTPKTEQTTVTTTATKPVWDSEVENPASADSSLTQNGSSTGVNSTTGSGNTSSDDTVSTSTTSTSTTSTTNATNNSGSMTSSSSVDNDDDTQTSTATETRTRLRKD